MSASLPVAVAVPATAAVPAAERRLVSVLFADLVGFTTISEKRDAEEVRELLSRYFAETRIVIELGVRIELTEVVLIELRETFEDGDVFLRRLDELDVHALSHFSHRSLSGRPSTVGTTT